MLRHLLLPLHWWLLLQASDFLLPQRPLLTVCHSAVLLALLWLGSLAWEFTVKLHRADHDCKLFQLSLEGMSSNWDLYNRFSLFTSWGWWPASCSPIILSSEQKPISLLGWRPAWFNPIIASNEQRLEMCEEEILQFQSMSNVRISKFLQSKILLFVVWPQNSTWEIWKWKSSMYEICSNLLDLIIHRFFVELNQYELMVRWVRLVMCVRQHWFYSRWYLYPT